MIFLKKERFYLENIFLIKERFYLKNIKYDTFSLKKMIDYLLLISN